MFETFRPVVTALFAIACTAALACDGESSPDTDDPNDPSGGKTDDPFEVPERQLELGDGTEGIVAPALGVSIEDDELFLFIEHGCFQTDYRLVWDGTLSDGDEPTAKLSARQLGDPRCADPGPIAVGFDIHGIAYASGLSDGAVTVAVDDFDTVRYEWEDYHLQVEDPPGPSAGFIIRTAVIVDDELSMQVSYSGGCQPHEFSLHWDGERTDDVVALELFHEDNGDICEALPSEKLRFWLGPLVDAVEGPVTIALSDFDGELRLE